MACRGGISWGTDDTTTLQYISTSCSSQEFNYDTGKLMMVLVIPTELLVVIVRLIMIVIEMVIVAAATVTVEVQK